MTTGPTSSAPSPPTLAYPTLAYPTPRALALTAAGVAAAITLGALAPERWLLGFLCAGFAALAVLADFALARRPGDLSLHVAAPVTLAQGSEGQVEVRAGFAGGRAARGEAALGGDERLAATPRTEAFREGRALFSLRALRRGRAALGPVQVRWTGPLGLVRRQSDVALQRHVTITPDLAPARAASRALGDNALGVARLDVRLGQGGEFRALRGYAAGDDRRMIDWKRSASRGMLLVKEHQLEQNHPVVLAIDCGRAMVEPIGVKPRLDHALSAALALAYTGLAVGDRLKLVGFDARVNVNGSFVSGRAAFAGLQAAGSRLDYAPENANYTLALHTIATGLDRRSLIVVFTEFTDTVGAELMLESVARLVRRHVVMFVVFGDSELEGLVSAPPQTPQDVSRAVVAASLLHQRALVLERLKRLGVRAVETTPERMGGAVVDAYLDLKRRELG